MKNIRTLHKRLPKFKNQTEDPVAVKQQHTINTVPGQINAYTLPDSWGLLFFFFLLANQQVGSLLIMFLHHPHCHQLRFALANCRLAVHNFLHQPDKHLDEVTSLV